MTFWVEMVEEEEDMEDRGTTTRTTIVRPATIEVEVAAVEEETEEVVVDMEAAVTAAATGRRTTRMTIADCVLVTRLGLFDDWTCKIDTGYNMLDHIGIIGGLEKQES
jgi:hypothetical protein